MALISTPKRQVGPYTKNNCGASDWSQNVCYTNLKKMWKIGSQENKK